MDYKRLCFNDLSLTNFVNRMTWIMWNGSDMLPLHIQDIVVI